MHSCCQQPCRHFVTRYRLLRWPWQRGPLEALLAACDGHGRLQLTGLRPCKLTQHSWPANLKAHTMTGVVFVSFKNAMQILQLHCRIQPRLALLCRTAHSETHSFRLGPAINKLDYVVCAAHVRTHYPMRQSTGHARELVHARASSAWQAMQCPARSCTPIRMC